MTRAVVLGGGGVTGVGWEIGLLAGLAEAGVDVSGADLVVGTSAGSVVGAQLANQVPLEEQYAAQVAGPGAETAPHLARGTLARFVAALLRHWRDPARFRARIGAISLRTRTPSEAERRAIIDSRLTVADWPATRLRIAAVDAVTGELRVFDADSGVPLADAVTASCAIPGMWPPATVAGRRYVDGGIASGTNAPLAAGHATVLVIAPVTTGGGPVPALRTEVAELERGGARVHVVTRSAAARKAAGRNPSDPGKRGDAARAGRAQAAEVAAEVAAFWD